MKEINNKGYASGCSSSIGDSSVAKSWWKEIQA
jgi:hypothetical protein